MRKGRIISVIAIFATVLMMMSCGYKNGPPGDDTPWPESLDGEYTSEYGSMSFIEDEDSIVVDFSEELANALNFQTGKRKGTYVFLFDHKEWRYDKADTLAITVDDNTCYLTNMFTQTNADRIVVCLPEFNDNEPITFERAR